MFLIFVAVSFLVGIVYIALRVMNSLELGDQLMQGLTSACVSDKRLYEEGIENELLRVVLLENWYTK